MAALRIYTTAAYKSINNPLRDAGRAAREEPHPLALTVTLISSAVSKLRVIGAQSEEANDSITLYRGMRNVEVRDDFFKQGGTELAPMSTTSTAS